MLNTITIKLCNVQDCEEEYYGNGLCKKHYMKQ